MKNEKPNVGRHLIHGLTTGGFARACSRTWFKLVPSFPIKRRIYGSVICYVDSRDTVHYWLMTKGILEGEKISDVLGSGSGLAWDVGCNIGIFSLLMASKGRPVVAFDLSERAIQYVKKSAQANGFQNVTAVARALSVSHVKYSVPTTARLGNKIESEGDHQALTFEEAARLYGTPTLIKMDIEGHEEVFLKSEAFKNWILTNKIKWVLEIHDPRFKELFWKGVPAEEVEPGQFLINK